MVSTRISKLPLLYTQPIGSLPRPEAVRELLRRRGELGESRFAGMLDDMVRFAIHVQELAGLDVVSDGEWRRVQYIREFLLRIGGFERCRPYHHQGEEKLTEVVVRRMTPGDPVFATDAQFLAANTDRVTKFALPSPFLIAVRYWHPRFSSDAYPTMQHFLDHLAELLTRESQALAAAGIDIVQIDDPALTYFCDPDLVAGQSHDERLRRSWDIDAELPLAIAAIHRIIDGLPCEVHLHCCHSVYKRRSDVRGDYKPLLPHLKQLRVHRVNLEFAYPQTGDFTDLKLLPSHLGVGMGVVDVRSEVLQSVEQITSLIEAGLDILPPNRIALNPDCGFAPDAGEPPTLDEAFEKLRRLVTAAKHVREKEALINDRARRVINGW